MTITKDNGRTVTIEVEADTVASATDAAIGAFQWRFGYSPSCRGAVVVPAGAA